MSPLASKRRLGYLVWAVAGFVIAVPEITAAFSHGALPFTTISEMVGHLERHWNPTELIVIATILFPLFSLIRVTPPPPSAPPPAGRTPGGRLTRPAPAPAVPPATFDAEAVPWQFTLAALCACSLAIAGTVLAIELWDDKSHFHPAYVLYGSLALFWLVAPSIFTFVKLKDPPYPTLFRTVFNLEDALRGWGWQPLGISVGEGLAWLVSFIIVWGLIVLLLHITLYPFPDITHILNPRG